MKNKLIIGITSIMMIMAVAAFSVSLSAPTAVSVADTEGTSEIQNTVVVNGTGTMQVAPDMATINIGVQTQNEDANIAQQENAKLMDQVVSAIKAQGIAAEDIKTAQYNLYKTSDYSSSTDKRKEYYVANNTVNVIVKDIDKVGSIIDVASSNGANNINNITFSVEDDSAFYQEALKLAMTNAKGKATAIMSTFGKTPSIPQQVNESSSGGSIVYNTEAVRALAMDSVSTPIESGQITITAKVSVTYGY
ncbi:MAG: uncharacterized protein PWP51_957 [Clostridiales bacterium]|jgi:uncharacterized protein YggE|nr:uncharacterized protein [Clostridiales bacterium]MDN5298404.1 uncharacterized protein [Clostridiales bacterium]